MKVLVVEDDPVLGKALQQGLQEAGHQCSWARAGDRGLKEILAMSADVILLDLMLPGMSGLDVLAEVRATGIHTPVIVVSALGSVDERVAGLEKGADDYLVKPFAFAELLARLQAVTRRTMATQSQRAEVGPLSLDLSLRRVSRNGNEIELTPTEFSLLEFLMRHEGQVVTRKMLCEHLWDADWEGVTNVIEVHINRLRGKIDRGFDEPLLHTVRGRGYVLRAVGERTTS